MSRELPRLLRSLFGNADELRSFLEDLPDGEKIVDLLAPNPSSWKALTEQAVEVLERRGGLDDSFFDLLAAMIPGRGKDIENARRSWRTGRHSPGEPVPDATISPRLRLVVDDLEKYRRRKSGKEIVYGTVELEDGTAAFGEGVLVHLTVENTAPHSSFVSGLCVRVEAFDPYPLEDFDYSQVAVASTHLEVPGTTTLEPLQLTEVEQPGSTLRIPPGRLFLGPANTPEAFHSLQFPVVAQVAGRWQFRIEVSTGLAPAEDPTPPPPTASVTVVKR